MDNILEQLKKKRIVPEVVIRNIEDAKPLAK